MGSSLNKNNRKTPPEQPESSSRATVFCHQSCCFTGANFHIFIARFLGKVTMPP